MGRTESRPRDYERAVVVELEFNGTNKSTLRSEGGSVLEKQKKTKKEQKKLKKDLDRADAVRDYREANAWLEGVALRRSP